MKTIVQKLALGVTVAVVTAPMFGALSAQAGGYNDGGLKGMRGTYVPVPAPVPVPDYKPRWYLRADVGLGMNLRPNTTESGMQYGRGDIGAFNAPNPFGYGGSFFDSFSSDTSDNIGHTIGIGAGYYATENVRFDFTGEIRMMKSSTLNGSFQYPDTNLHSVPHQYTGFDVLGDVQDRTTLRSAVFMANAYYDFTRAGRFKPYIGGGLGFAVNEVERSHTTNFAVCNTQYDAYCDSPTNAGSYNSQKHRSYTYSLAANLTAGVTYRVSDVTSLDFNYRYLYVGGTSASATINGHDSTVNIDDQHEHYLRAGLRWDIN